MRIHKKSELEGGPHLIRLAPLCQSPSLQNYEKCLLFVSHPVRGVLLWQPTLTNTAFLKDKGSLKQPNITITLSQLQNVSLTLSFHQTSADALTRGAKALLWSAQSAYWQSLLPAVKTTFVIRDLHFAASVF